MSSNKNPLRKPSHGLQSYTSRSPPKTPPELMHLPNLSSSFVTPQTSQPLRKTTLKEAHVKNPSTWSLTCFCMKSYPPLFQGRAQTRVVAIAPTNSFLVGSVISATATKQGLCTSAAQIGAIARGIHFPSSEYQLHSNPEAWEASSLGACLQFLISGSVFCNDGQLGRNKKQLLPSIKSLLAGETIKDANGKKLLQVRTAAILLPSIA